MIDELPRGFTELAFGQRFCVRPNKTFVIGGSFGGAAAILCSLDRRVSRVVANCPVVNWSILAEEEKKETSNPNYAAYIRKAFGHGYRLSDRNWNKLRAGNFYNPMKHVADIDASKIMIVHAKDDPYIPYESVKNFAQRAGVRMKSLRAGGHLSTEIVVRRYWAQIRRFFDQAQ